MSLKLSIAGIIPESLKGYENIVVSLMIVVASVVIARIATLIIDRYLKNYAKNTKSDIDDRIIEIMHKPLYYAIILIGVQIAISYILLPEKYSGLFGKLISTALIALVAWVVAGIMDILLKEFGRKLAIRAKTTADEEAIPFLSRIVKIGIYLIAITIILSQFIDVTPIVASLGIAGFAVSFAAQSTIANIISGFLIITDRPFSRGDRIEIDKYVGEVVDIGLRTTKLRTLDNTIVLVPNSKITSVEVVNYALPDLRIKLDILFSVEYGSDIDNIKRVVLETAKNTNLVLSDPAPAVYLGKFGDFSLDFNLIFWINDFRDEFKVKDIINSAIYKRFEKEGIKIPFPTRTIYMKALPS